MKHICLLIIFFSSVFNSNAQKEASWWYFGNGAGLDFTSGSPVSVGGGQTLTVEGTACISDVNGDLLFYTDGGGVWNKNHVAMPNGFGLSGNNSSTQSALIVQKPGSTNLFYIFTTGSTTFDYSIVDMTLSGGNGDVTSKNVLMHPSSTERSTAVRKPNGIDFWIIGHEIGNNTFFVYELTNSGVSAVPVLSSVGLMQITGGDEIGYVKANPDRTKLAMAVRYDNLFEIFDFDNATGIISNAITFPATYPYSYGVEFSPDGSRLYMSGGSSAAYLYQVDMTAPNPAAIIASSTLIANPANGGAMGTVQTGPDCKLYVAKYGTTNMGVINDPNALGLACNYVDNQIALSFGTSQSGLPNYFEMTSCASLNFTPTCLGDSTYFSLGFTSALAAASWDFGDPGSGLNNFSNVFSPVHFYTAAGIYNVQLIKYYLNGSSDTTYVQVDVHALPVPFLGNDTTICDGTNLLIDASGYAGYLWNDGSTNATLTVSDSGLYFVTVSDGVCSGTDSINITTINCTQPIVAIAASDSSFCEKQCIDFADLSTNSPTSWQWFFPGAVPDTSTAQNPNDICYNNYGNFDVQLIACNGNGCDTLLLQNFINEYPNPFDSIWQSNDTLYSLPASGYQWYETTSGIITGETNQYFVLSQPGSYFCVITDSIGCVGTSNTIAITNLTDPPAPQWGVHAIVPNPNNGNFEIVFTSPFGGRGALRIFNSIGQVVFNSTLITQRSQITTQLETGIYFAEVKTSEQVFREKLIIKK